MNEQQERLIQGLKNGDKKVFEEIYNLYYTRLTFYCLSYVGTMQDAEEIVQSLFLKLWVKRNELEISKSLKGYLFRSVENEALNYIYHKKVKDKYNRHKATLNKNRFENIQKKMEEQELELIIKRAILKLPEKRRKIFELSRFEGLKYSEIAEKLSISVKTVESQMIKALKAMRKALKDYLPALAVLMFWFIV